MTVDAVIVTCNSAGDLQTLFGCKALCDEVDRFVVVDNGSHDRSAQVARAAGATVLARHTTSGYGAAANLGAARTNGAVFVLMNPDIRFVERSTLNRLLRVLEDPAVAIVAPALRLPDGSIQDSARLVPTPLDLGIRRHVRPMHGAVIGRREVPWVTGAFVVIRRSAFEALGGFDERFPLYFEDVDLCVRAWRAGWKVVYEPGVLLEHRHHAASRRTLLGLATRRHIRSAVRFYVKHPRHLVVREPSIRADS